MLKQDLKMEVKVGAFSVRAVNAKRKPGRKIDTRIKEHYKVYRITPEVITRIINRIKDL